MSRESRIKKTGRTHCGRVRRLFSLFTRYSFSALHHLRPASIEVPNPLATSSSSLPPLCYVMFFHASEHVHILQLVDTRPFFSLFAPNDTKPQTIPISLIISSSAYISLPFDSPPSTVLGSKAKQAGSLKGCRMFKPLAMGLYLFAVHYINLAWLGLALTCLFILLWPTCVLYFSLFSFYFFLFFFFIDGQLTSCAFRCLFLFPASGIDTAMRLD